ncbi:MAG TPA: cysteine rich repeat-containing protein [Xanthobacteraceae bacterium]|nr:cysteine rich repeat-containing protein [Xanthobacteraceae bacterium]
MKNHRLIRRVPRLLAVAGLLVGILPGLALPAAAQQPTINPEQACKDDAFKFCNDLIPDREKVGACLRRNARKLTKDCHTVVLGGGAPHRAPHRTYHHYHHTH